MTPHREVLSREAMRLLGSLGGILGPSYYLAGGTGLALQAGHRKSEDLAFFRHAPGLVLPARERLKRSLLEAGRYQILSEDEGTLHLAYGDTRVSLLASRPPLLRKAIRMDRALVADPVDIGLMKISAVIGRGAKKDFIDMACLLKEYVALAELLRLAPKKFPESREISFLALKALVYFADAEAEPDPVILKGEYRWSPVKAFLRSEVTKASSALTSQRRRT
ncbi:MAG: nucleotidyl transferase AbiEii/AbiGii toxin family protein [Candidatus Coatesbacteria bacterium]